MAFESVRLIKDLTGEYIEFGGTDEARQYIKQIGGLGNTGIDYATQSGFFQHGSTVTNMKAQPRTLSFPIYKPLDGDGRDDFWETRMGFLRMLNGISSTLTLRIIRHDLRVFELRNIYPTPGLVMEGNTDSFERNDGAIDEVLQLTAFDPIWYEVPSDLGSSLFVTGELQDDTVGGLSFPFAFDDDNIVFTSAGRYISTGLPDSNGDTFEYVGTWISYPKVTLTGPYTTVTITNLWNDASITLYVPIGIGETRIVDLTNPVDGFNITDGSGNNKIGELLLESSLTNFFFSPDVDDNGISVSFLGGDSNSTAIMEWGARYLGI